MSPGLVILFIVLAAAVAVVGRLLYLRRDRYDHLRRLGTVREGVLYRCGQPDADDLARIHEKYKFRTVVALRAGIDNPKRNAWAGPEQAFCRENDIKFVSLPSNTKHPPTPEQFQTFVDLFGDPQRQPVLVHCKRGQQRTGIFCAAYRMAREGWSQEQAMQELDDLGFGLNVGRHQELRRSFEQFAAGLKQRNNDGAAHRTENA